MREVSPDTRVVILTMQEDPEFARQALRAGAAGYVLKEAADDELVTAVRRVAAGETYLNPRLGRGPGRRAPEPSGPPDDLTEREVEVLRLIALGHTNAEIAQQLFLSVRTVESHRAHIQQKLGRSTRAELVRYASTTGSSGRADRYGYGCSWPSAKSRGAPGRSRSSPSAKSRGAPGRTRSSPSAKSRGAPGKVSLLALGEVARRCLGMGLRLVLSHGSSPAVESTHRVAVEGPPSFPRARP